MGGDRDQPPPRPTAPPEPSAPALSPETGGPPPRPTAPPEPSAPVLSPETGAIPQGNENETRYLRHRVRELEEEVGNLMKDLEGCVGRQREMGRGVEGVEVECERYGFALPTCVVIFEGLC